MPASRVALDIETYTGGVTPDGERTGLDPRYTPIISVAATFAHEGEFFAYPHERDILAALEEWMREFAPQAELLVTWNGANFDLPFLATRAAMNNIEISLSLRPSELRPPKYRVCPGYSAGQLANWAGTDHVDLMYAYEDFARTSNIRWGLKPVARAMGLDPIEVDATNMEALSNDELRLYNLSDVDTTLELSYLSDITPWRDSLVS